VRRKNELSRGDAIGEDKRPGDGWRLRATGRDVPDVEKEGDGGKNVEE
jgi:hypothetical protein